MVNGRKSRALMIIIEKLVARHHRGLIVIDEPGFELFEIAKRIEWARDEASLQGALTALADFNK